MYLHCFPTTHNAQQPWKQNQNPTRWDTAISISVGLLYSKPVFFSLLGDGKARQAKQHGHPAAEDVA